MTGANRLLIGLGWSMVVFIAWYRLRKAGRIAPGRRWKGIELTRDHSIELGFLWVATLYSLTLPLKASITLIDSVILVGAVRRVHVEGLASAGRGTPSRGTGPVPGIVPGLHAARVGDRTVPRHRGS